MVRGNTLSRHGESHSAGIATFSYGGYPEIDGLFREQSPQLDRAKREATLHRIQQLVQERAMVAPIYELAFLTGVGPRVEEPALGLIPGMRSPRRTRT
jgi:hypothetical protein